MTERDLTDPEGVEALAEEHDGSADAPYTPTTTGLWHRETAATLRALSARLAAAERRAEEAEARLDSDRLCDALSEALDEQAHLTSQGEALDMHRLARAVRALEWEDDGGPDDEPGTVWAARDPYGVAYRIEREREDGDWWRAGQWTISHASLYVCTDPSDTLEEAQAAAQADFDARIRACIEPAPDPVKEAAWDGRPMSSDAFILRLLYAYASDRADAYDLMSGIEAWLSGDWSAALAVLTPEASDDRA